MNDLLRTRREMVLSRSGSGAPMSRSELAEAVNEYVRVKTGRASGLRRAEVWRWERGTVRWPGKLYREALRTILDVESDEDLGFVPVTRTRSAPQEPAVVSEHPDDVVSGREQRASSFGLARYGGELVVRALIRHDGRLLLVREAGTHWSSLPGGRVGGMPVQSSLIRHVARQTGLEVAIVGFVGGVEHHSVDADVQHTITLVFEAQATSSGRTGHGEDLGLQWLDVGEVADHDLRPVALRDALVDGVDGAFWRAWAL